MRLGPFLGLVTSVGPEFIPDSAASDMLNYEIEDGALTPCFGYRNLAAARTNYDAAIGVVALEYLQGYDSSNNLVEEYISFERDTVNNAANKVSPFSRSVTTGAATEILNSAARLNLTTSGQWRGFSWRDVAYWMNPNETTTLYKHTLGSTTSFTPIAVPASPANPPTVACVYGSSGSQYARLSWAGLTVASDLTVTGNANASASYLTANVLNVAHTGAPQASSVTIDLSETTAATGSNYSFDWYDNDIFGLSLYSGELGNSLAPGLVIDPQSLRIEFIDSAGTTTFTPSATEYTFQRSDVGFGFTMAVRFKFDGKTRSAWGSGSVTPANVAVGLANGKVKKLKLSYTVTGGSGNVSFNFLRIDSMVIGGVEMLQWNGDFEQEDMLQFAYSHYNSSTGFESGLSAKVTAMNTLIDGTKPFAQLKPFGTWLTVTGANSSETDNNRLYVRVQSLTTGAFEWKRVATQADSTLAIPYRITYSERLALSGYSNISPFTLTGLKFGVQWKGWVVWCYTGGYQNIRHSRVGDPEKQALTTDSPNDEDAISHGQTFSLADNFGDEPLNAFPCDDVLLVAGSNGVYAQQGPYPSALTPFKRLPGDQGVAGPFACCRWLDDQGQPGMVFVSKNGDGVYFAVVSDATDERGMRVVPLDTAIQGQLIEWLRDGQSLTNFDTCRVWVDQQQDSLWVAMKNRALILRRPSHVDKKRQWIKREWTMANSATLAQVSSSTRRRVRWMRSTGLFDENEYNSNTNVYITGSSRDGGSTMIAPYWVSGKDQGENRQLMNIFIERDDLTDTPTITNYCNRQSSGVSRTVASGARYVRFSHLQSGWYHQFKILGAETNDPIRSLVPEYARLGSEVKIT